MTRIKKESLKIHILVFDTSVLWHDDKSYTVNPSFDEMLKDCSKLIQLELVIPETVFGELHFQQTTSAIKSLDKANQAFKEVSSIAAFAYSHKITSNKIKLNIKTKIDRWLVEHRVRIEETPIEKIDWKKLIEKSIWREPPFTFDPKDKINEKGFRDALILETLVELCRNENRDVNIAFLSSDTLLRTTAEQSLKSDNRCLFFDSIDGFKSYIKLSGEELTQKFIGRLLARATTKFFTKGDETCLFLREAITTKLQEKYKDYYTNPQKAESSSLFLFSEWQTFGQVKLFIGSAKFIGMANKNIYKWVNKVTSVCMYRANTSGTTLLTQPYSMKQLLVLDFTITWHAFVKADGRFHDIALEDIALESSSFKEPTAEQIKQYNIQNEENLTSR